MSKFRYKVELNTIDDVKKFTDAVAQVKDCDVRLIGKDENGANWDISAKSLFCSLMMSQRLQTLVRMRKRDLQSYHGFCKVSGKHKKQHKQINQILFLSSF